MFRTAQDSDVEPIVVESLLAELSARSSYSNGVSSRSIVTTIRSYIYTKQQERHTGLFTTKNLLSGSAPQEVLNIPNRNHIYIV